MDTALERPWTTESFLTWEDRQEAKHEFDGRHVIDMTGGSFAHQDIVHNLRGLLGRLLADRPFRVGQKMRLRIGTRVRYPDVVVCAGPVDQKARTLADAIAIFEVLSADTATTDRVNKLLEYAELPSLRCYVLLGQAAIAATLFQRQPGEPWIASAHTAGTLSLPGVDAALDLPDLYRGLQFPGPSQQPAD